MRAVRIEKTNAPWKVVEAPVPEPGPGEALVRVRASGICGADLEITRGEYPLARAPLTPGHEVAGIVEQTGADVAAFRAGDRVGLGWLQGICGKCEACFAGKENLCAEQRATGVNVDGGHAEYVVAPVAYLHHLPEQLSFEHAAALMCPGMTAYSAIKISGVRPGARIAVLGLGGVGHLAVLLARAVGAQVAVVTRGGEEKMEWARKLGADYVLDSRGESAGRLLQSVGGADLILSVTISETEAGDAIDGLRPDGTMVLIGVPTRPIPVPADPMCAGRRRILGLPSGSRTEVRETLEFAARRRIAPLIETFPLADARRAIERMGKGLVRFRAILVP